MQCFARIDSQFSDGGQSFAIDRSVPPPPLFAARYACVVKSSFPTQSFLIAGAIILALYFAVFYGIEGCRHAKGPWRVTFAASNEIPRIDVAQERLKFFATLVFVGEANTATNLPQAVIFDQPKRSIPFGRVIYEDLTQLPGVVTFDLFGHEIELLPRALIVNKREVPWNSRPSIELFATNKPATPPQPAPGWK
ncbi:MAG: hypothetical protein L0Y58_03300 [Verrucomicrobia subdivision 3 bacterium]|nr:hypothetical protein [Limisphaerales bacterium]